MSLTRIRYSVLHVTPSLGELSPMSILAVTAKYPIKYNQLRTAVCSAKAKSFCSRSSQSSE